MAARKQSVFAPVEGESSGGGGIEAPPHHPGDGGSREPTFRFQEASRAPLSPHELADERRDDYLAELWQLFSERAVKSRISWADAIHLAIAFPIEGAATGALERLRPESASSGMTFEELVDVLDAVSKAASEEYRDIDMEQREAQDEVELPPHKFLCSKLPCGGYPGDVKYRLEEGWRLADVKPKTKLIITTASLMVVIGVALLVIIYQLWSDSNRTREEQSFFTTRSTLHYLINKYELSFYEDHYHEMADQTVILAGLADFFMRRGRSNQLARNWRTAERISAAGEAPPTLPFTGIIAASDGLGTQGVVFERRELLEAFHAAGSSQNVVHTAQNSTEAEVTCRALASSGLRRHMFIASDSSRETAACVAVDSRRMHTVPRRTIDSANAIDRNGTTAGVITNSSFPPSCSSSDGTSHCESLRDTLNLNVNAVNRTFVGSAFGNSSALVGYAPRAEGGVIVVATDDVKFRIDKQDEFILEIQFLNFAFVRTTEIVVGRFDHSVGRFITQATLFRFGGCYAECERLPPARRNAERSWETQAPAGSITPDYRPEPVAGASQYMPTMEAVLLLERDVQEIRGLGLTSLIEIMNDLAMALPEVDIMVFRHAGRPPMRDFDPGTPCAADEDCLSLPEPVGVFFKYNCVHCQRVPAFPRNATIEILTELTKPLQDDATSADEVVLDDVFATILHDRSNVTKRFVDYSGVEVLGHGFFVVNYSIGVMVTVDASEFRDKWWRQPVMSVLVSAAVLVAGLGLILISTNLSLSSMEEDWLTAKEEIEREKAHFAKIVGDLVPPNLSARMLRGQKVVAETLNNAVIVFSDICGFTDATAALSPKHVVRYVAYCFHCLQTVADDCDLLRLGSIGDAYVVYASTSGNYKSRPETHAAVRGARFGVLAAMVFSPLVHHWPETIRAFRDGFKDRAKATEPFRVPRIRFGAHCGVIPSGIIQGDGAPRFDAYGLVPALAARMCTTSAPDRLHVTAFMRDAIAANDTGRTFLFDDPRKTIVRGQGTVTSYFVRATTQDLANGLLESLHVQRAPLTVIFDGAKRRRGKDTLSNSERLSSVGGAHQGRAESSKQESSSVRSR